MTWLLLAVTLAQAKPQAPAVQRIMAPRDAVTMALADLGQNVPRESQPYQWYVWNNDGTKKSAAALNFTVNAVISKATTIVQPKLVSDGKLLRYNLLELAPRRRDFLRLWKQLQELAVFEPYFHQPGKKWIKAAVDRYKYRGRWFTWKWKLAQEFGIHAGGAGPLPLLSGLMGGNPLPIVRGDWLLCTAWQTVDIDGIRGRYYELSGIGQQNFDKFLASVGADPKLVAKLRADQRAVMIGGPTGNWRMVEAFFAAGTRPETGPSLITITHDIQDDDTDAKRHPLLNLLEFKDRAREVIAPRPNGLHLFALFNGEGELQDEAPPGDDGK